MRGTGGNAQQAADIPAYVPPVSATSMKNTAQQTVYHEAFRYDYLVVAQRPFTPPCFSANGDTGRGDSRRRW